MIYRNAGNYVGARLYDNIPNFIFYFTIVVMPQLILSLYMIRNMYAIPESLIDAQMFNPRELQPGKISKSMVLPIILAITMVSIGGGYLFAKKYAKK